MRPILIVVLAGALAAAQAQQETVAPSASEIARAKSQGLVWVKHKAKQFHKPGMPGYGVGKGGEFMTEEAAIKGGNRLAKAFQPKIGKRAADERAVEPKK